MGVINRFCTFENGKCYVSNCKNASDYISQFANNVCVNVYQSYNEKYIFKYYSHVAYNIRR